jgi:hypothetical protein
MLLRAGPFHADFFPPGLLIDKSLVNDNVPNEIVFLPTMGMLHLPRPNLCSGEIAKHVYKVINHNSGRHAIVDWCRGKVPTVKSSDTTL